MKLRSLGYPGRRQPRGAQLEKQQHTRGELVTAKSNKRLRAVTDDRTQETSRPSSQFQARILHLQSEQAVYGGRVPRERKYDIALLVSVFQRFFVVSPPLSLRPSRARSLRFSLHFDVLGIHS